MLKFETVLAYDKNTRLKIKSLDCENNNKYDPRSCGVYIFLLDGIPLYIGKAGIFLNRLSGHLNKCSKNISYFGVKSLLSQPKHTNLTIHYAILKICDNEDLAKKEEVELIKNLFPLTQWPRENYIMPYKTKLHDSANDYVSMLSKLKTLRSDNDTDNQIHEEYINAIVSAVINDENHREHYRDIINTLNDLLKPSPPFDP